MVGASAPNVGLKLTIEELAEGIIRRSGDDKFSYTVIDPSMGATSGGPSLAERLYRAGVGGLRPADNRRVSQRGAMGGWDQMRARIRGDGENPMLFVFSTCKDFIRTLPALQHDPDRPEDLDTGAEDHVADECRYACMSRPMTPKRTEHVPDDYPINPTGKHANWGPRTWKYLNEMTYDELHEALKLDHRRDRVRI